MKFIRIPSKLRVSAYPDMKVGSVVKLRGSFFKKHPPYLVLQQFNRANYNASQRTKNCNRVLRLLSANGKITRIFLENVKEYCE